MSPFAQLGTFDFAGKSASVGSALWGGLKTMYNHGVWGTAGKLAERGVARPGALGALARGTKAVSGAMDGGIGLGLGAYGIMAGVAAPLTGVKLPGSDLALNIGMPGIGAANSAASLIQTGRLGTQRNQDAIRRDAQAGAQAATSDFITGIDRDPTTARDPAAYRKFMQRNGIGFDAADKYGANAYTRPMGTWHTLQSAFENPQDMVNHRVRQTIQEQLAKQSSLGAVGKALWSGGGKVMHAADHVIKPLMIGGAAYGVGDAVLSDKPYDPAPVQQEGYAGAQAAIQKRLAGLTPMERLGARMDPTLAMGAVEKRMPGSIAAWEKQTGRKYQPGFISSAMDSWNGGGKTKFYTYDAGYDNRRYLD